MRRVYRRRSDMLVFMSLGLVIIAVVTVYFVTHGEKAGEPGAGGAAADTSGPQERLMVLRVDEPGRLMLERDAVAASMPHLVAAFDEAKVTGVGAIDGPLLVDAIWLQLANEYGAIPRVPLVVGFEGDSYRLQMVR